MSDVDPTRLVTELIAGERLTTPTVKPIEPEVRSGGFFPFCDLLKHGETRKRFQQFLLDSVLLGALVIEWVTTFRSTSTKSSKVADQQRGKDCSGATNRRALPRHLCGFSD